MGSNRHAVPGIDSHYHHNGLRHQRFTQCRYRLLVGGIRHAAPADKGNFFGQGQQRLLLGGKQGGFAPGVEEVKALLGFAVLPGGAGVYVEALSWEARISIRVSCVWLSFEVPMYLTSA